MVKYNESMIYYSRNEVSQSIRKYTPIKVRNQLYVICGITEKVLHIVRSITNTLSEKESAVMGNLLKQTDDTLHEMVYDLKTTNGSPSSIYLNKDIIDGYKDEFTKYLVVGILADNQLTHKDYYAHILNNLLVLLTNTAGCIKYIHNLRSWNRMIELLGDMIQYLNPNYDDDNKEATIAYTSTYRLIFNLKRNEELVYVEEWDTILLDKIGVHNETSTNNQL